jgi:histone acetyltransferase
VVTPTLFSQDHQSIPLSPASSILSDLPQPPTKRRRISLSPLSDADDNDDASGEDDDDDDEDQPLAARISSKTTAEKRTRISNSHRSGKAVSSKRSKKARAAPLPEEPVKLNGVTNGINGVDAKVKVEDVMDEDQLTRLAAGTTVDATRGASSGASTLLSALP